MALPYRFVPIDGSLQTIAARFGCRAEDIYQLNAQGHGVAAGMSLEAFEAAVRADRVAFNIEPPARDLELEWHEYTVSRPETLQALCDRVARAEHDSDVCPGARLEPDPNTHGHWNARRVWFALVNAMLRYRLLSARAPGEVPALEVNPGDVELPAGTVLRLPFRRFLATDEAPAAPAPAPASQGPESIGRGASAASPRTHTTMSLPPAWVTDLVRELAEIEHLTETLNGTLHRCSETLDTAAREAFRLRHLDAVLGTLADLQGHPTRFDPAAPTVRPPQGFNAESNPRRAPYDATSADRGHVTRRREAIRTLRGHLVDHTNDPLAPASREEKLKPADTLIQVLNPGLVHQRLGQSRALLNRLLSARLRELALHLREPSAYHLPGGMALSQRADRVLGDALGSLHLCDKVTAGVVQALASELTGDEHASADASAVHIVARLYLEVPHDHGSKLIEKLLKLALAYRSAAAAVASAARSATAAPLSAIARVLPDVMRDFDAAALRPLAADRFDRLWLAAIERGRAESHGGAASLRRQIEEALERDNSVASLPRTFPAGARPALPPVDTSNVPADDVLADLDRIDAASRAGAANGAPGRSPHYGEYIALRDRINALGSTFNLTEAAMSTAVALLALQKLANAPDAIPGPAPSGPQHGRAPLPRWVGWLTMIADTGSGATGFTREGIKVIAHACALSARMTADSVDTVGVALRLDGWAAEARGLVGKSAVFGNTVGAVGAVFSMVSAALGLYREVDAHGFERRLHLAGYALQFVGGATQFYFYVAAMAAPVPVWGQCVAAGIVLAGVVIALLDGEPADIAVIDAQTYVQRHLQVFERNRDIRTLRAATAAIATSLEVAHALVDAPEHWYQFSQTAPMLRELRRLQVPDTEARILVRALASRQPPRAG